MVSYDTIRKITIVCHCLGALLLFIISVVRFVQFDFTSSTFVLSIYYILFGLIIVCCEIGFAKVLEQFYFMNYSFGKALFAGFIATLTFTLYWLQLAVSIFFMVACAGFIILGLFYTSAETDKAVQKSPAQEEGKADSEPKKEQEMDNQLPAPQV